MKRADRERKLRSAERLFETMGMIDDRIIAEAQEAYMNNERKHSVPLFKKALATSMALIVLVTGMIGGFIISNIADRNTNDDLDAIVGDSVNSTAASRLDVLLVEAVETSVIESTPLELIDFFDGEVSLIWNYEGESDYYKLVFDVNGAENTVKNQMQRATQKVSPTGAEEMSCKVWISYGNGEIVSPYLKQSSGNIGYSTLFDYSPEVIPSESFIELVSDALGDR